MLDILKRRWGFKSNFDIFIVMVVFAVTGSSSVFVKRYIFEYFHIDELNIYLYIILYVLIIFPLYQLFLLMYGFVFGKFKFFLEFEKKMLSRMGLKFLFKK